MCSCPSNTTGNAFFSCSPILGNSAFYTSSYTFVTKTLNCITNLINSISPGKICLIELLFLAVPEFRHPCEPSPCGPYSTCRTMNEQGICSCLIGYIGVPPSCRPECLVDSDCTSLMSCSNQKCIEPCRGSCGLRAECRVHNHNPICYCPNGYTGDPFTQCLQLQSKNIFK